MNDPVNHPAHYTDGNIEVIDFIEDKRLSYHLGNTVKYICRAGKKDPAKTCEDLEKAAWYLNRHIQNLKNIAPNCGGCKFGSEGLCMEGGTQSEQPATGVCTGYTPRNEGEQ